MAFEATFYAFFNIQTMQYSFLDFLTLIGAVGLFLYGMKVMSEGLQKVAGDRLRSIMSAMTKNRFAGLITGILITALIQSSSASTVMVVSFVNAGLMSLADSMAVIMGANVGTTFTAWIIAVFGQVKIDVFMLPLIGIATCFLFSKKSSHKSIAEFFIGFALLFIGLGYISDNVPELDENALEFLRSYTDMGFLTILLFAVVGIVITMIIQSSAAAFAIIMVMCLKGWIGFDIACAMVLGSNIGTTITPIIASLSANDAAKKAAFGHLLFNCIGMVWALALIYPLINVVSAISEFFGIGDPRNGDGSTFTLALSIFHTIFNVVNVCILIWFTKYFVVVANFFFKPKKHHEDDEFQLKYISSRIVSAAEVNITLAQREIVVYAERVNRMFGMVKTMLHTKPDSEEFNKIYSRIGKYEEISDRMEIEIANFLNKVIDGRLSYEGKLRISAMLNIVSEIESIGDSCNNLARTMVRQHEAKVVFNKMIVENIETMFKYVSESLENMLLILRDIENASDKDIMNSYNKEREINNYRNALRSENVENINQRTYPYEEGIYYMDLICESEKLGDYVVNVIDGVKSQNEEVVSK